MSEEFGSKLERPLKPGEILVFSEEDYQGKEWLISENMSHFDQEFAVASFRLGPKTGVTLFSDSEYKGISQELTAELGSFNESKLQGQKAKSLKIWLSAGKAFTGYWVIEAAEGRYLSVQPDTNGVGVLRTNPTVSDSEAFRIKDRGQAGLGRRKAAFQVRGTREGEPLPARKRQTLTIDDLQKVTVVDEQEMGFRKFSLLVEGLWISYEPEEDRFRTTAEAQKRTIFCHSIKIAENETQVGELGLGEVALYENPCYWGKAWVFYKDYADFKRVVDLNDEVSSIQLGPLTGATIYRETQFSADDPRAGQQDIISNIPSLAMEQVGEDQISSIDLWRITPPGDLGVTFTCSLSQDFRGAGNTFEEYSAYRTTLRLPPTVDSVEVWTTDQTVIEIEDQTYEVDEDKPVTLQPNMIQCLVITTDAKVSSNGEASRGSLSAPGLKIRTNTMLPHERIVILPDQEVHARLADMKEGELWNATYKDRMGKTQNLIKDRSPQKQTDAANAQNMITKIMSTVKYSKSAYGGDEQSIAPEELHGQYWALDFSTYRVKASTLYVREGPGTNFTAVGFLRKNDIVEALEFNPDASWVRLRRISDGLTGWSARIYMDKIAETPLTGDQYQVTASRLYLREGPGTEFRALGALQRNEIVTAIGMNDTGTWRQIRCSDGRVGWSSARYMVLVLPSDEVFGNSYRLSGNLKVREGPGTNFKTVGYLLTDDVVEALEADAEGTWLRIRRTSDGLMGWAWSRYLVRMTLPLSTSQEPKITPETAEKPEGPLAVSASLPTPLPDVIALSPAVKFHKTSEEELQALLALAESPDTDLAQGLFDDIFDAVRTAVSFVVAEVKEGVAIIVKFADKVVKWIVDTVEKAVSFVEVIFEKIGVMINDVIDWLKFVFDWDDILQTRDTLQKIMLDSLDYVSDTLVLQAKDKVSQFTGNSRDFIDIIFNQAIDVLGVRNQPGAGEPSFTSTILSAIEESGIPDTIEWIVSKILSSFGSMGGGVFATASVGKFEPGDPAEDEKLLSFWQDTLADGLENVVEIPEGVFDILIALQKYPDEPQIALVRLLKLFRDQAVGLIQFGEKIVLGLLDLTAHLIKTILKLLSTKIRIPFLSDILEWFGKSGDLGFSILDAITLIMAIPITAIYKASFHESPFKDTSYPLAQAEDRLPAIIAGVCDVIGGLLSIPLDLIPETDTGKKGAPAASAASATLNKRDKSITAPEILEIIIWGSATVSWFFNWRDYFSRIDEIDFPQNWKKVPEFLKEILELALFLLETGLLFLGDILFFIVGKIITTEKIERLKRGTERTIWISTVLGVVHLALATFNGIVDKKEDFLDVIFSALQIFPEVTSFLRLPKFINPDTIMVIVGIDDFAVVASLGSMAWNLTEP